VIFNVVDGANFQPLITPGGFVTIYGRNFTTTTADWNSAIADGTALPTNLGGISVQINQKPCYISYVSPTQLNVLTGPDFDVVFTRAVSVTVNTGPEAVSAVAWITQVAPGFFSYRIGGKQYPAALFANTSIYVAAVGAFPISSSRPAKPGDYLEFFATGLGPTVMDYPVGQVLSDAYPISDLSRVKATIGGKAAPVWYAGLTFAGVFQVNVQVPAGIPDGELPVALTVDGKSSPPGTVLPFQSQ
jgi:uncharacterized protein (TIGR03437 family)